jgi:hypothetical protein
MCFDNTESEPTTLTIKFSRMLTCFRSRIKLENTGPVRTEGHGCLQTDPHPSRCVRMTNPGMGGNLVLFIMKCPQ